MSVQQCNGRHGSVRVCGQGKQGRQGAGNSGDKQTGRA